MIAIICNGERVIWYERLYRIFWKLRGQHESLQFQKGAKTQQQQDNNKTRSLPL